MNLWIKPSAEQRLEAKESGLGEKGKEHLIQLGHQEVMGPQTKHKFSRPHFLHQKKKGQMTFSIHFSSNFPVIYLKDYFLLGPVNQVQPRDHPRGTPKVNLNFYDNDTISL